VLGGGQVHGPARRQGRTDVRHQGPAGPARRAPRAAQGLPAPTKSVAAPPVGRPSQATAVFHFWDRLMARRGRIGARSDQGQHLLRQPAELRHRIAHGRNPEGDARRLQSVQGKAAKRDLPIRLGRFRDPVLRASTENAMDITTLAPC
jgi:hypothetical protein